MARPLKESVLVDVAAAVKVAWSPAQISIGTPLTVPQAYPYANVQIASITRRQGSPTYRSDDYRILVTGRFAYPATSTDLLGTEQIERANDATDELINNATLAAVSYGTLQDVSEINFDTDEEAAQYYQVSLIYQITITGQIR
jgi:hypothetical protein